MSVEIKIEGISTLPGYAEIPMAFTVARILAVRDSGLNGISLEEQIVDNFLNPADNYRRSFWNLPADKGYNFTGLICFTEVD